MMKLSQLSLELLSPASAHFLHFVIDAFESTFHFVIGHTKPVT